MKSLHFEIDSVYEEQGSKFIMEVFDEQTTEEEIGKFISRNELIGYKLVTKEQNKGITIVEMVM